jgi:hypothetical protein
MGIIECGRVWRCSKQQLSSSCMPLLCRQSKRRHVFTVGGGCQHCCSASVCRQQRRHGSCAPTARCQMQRGKPAIDDGMGCIRCSGKQGLELLSTPTHSSHVQRSPAAAIPNTSGDWRCRQHQIHRCTVQVNCCTRQRGPPLAIKARRCCRHRL